MRRTPFRAALPALVLLAVMAPAAGAVQVPPTPVAPAPAPSAFVQRGVNVSPAQGSPHASASRSHVELGTVTPGVGVKDSVDVLNIGPEPLTVDLYVADAIPSFGGGYGFTARDVKGKDVGLWVTLPTARLTLAPRTAARVPYTVVVPAGAPGGEYVGGIVAEPVVASASGVQTVTRFAMAVYLTVPGGAAGATPGRGTRQGQLTITKVELRHQGSKTCPVVDYRNDSQRVLDPVGTVEMRGGLFGGSERRVSKERAGGVLPGTSAVGVALPCVKTPVGRATVEVTLAAPGQETAARAEHLTNIPFVVVFAGLLPLLLLLLLLVSLLARRRSRRAGVTGVVPATEEADRPVAAPVP